MLSEIISDKFFNNGLVLYPENNYEKDIFKIKSNKIKNYIEKYGAIIFRDFNINHKNLSKFTDLFTKEYSRDAIRRAERFNNNKIRNVDIGFQKVDLHSEASFTTAWPEVITFYCKKPPKFSGYSLLCDGVKLWNCLSTNSKEFFLSNPVIFKVKIPINKNNNFKGIKKWPMDYIGYHNGILNWDKGFISYNLKKFCVHESKLKNKLCFSNHLFVTLKSEPQLKKRYFEYKKNDLKKIMKEIKVKSSLMSHKLLLKKNDLLLIDNRRFMHGRTNINVKDKDRDIVILQSLKTIF